MLTNALSAALDAPSRHILCVIGIGRTGTNHFLNCIDIAIPEVDTRFEIFHHQVAYTLTLHDLEILEQLAGQYFTGIEDPALISFMQDNPGKVVTALSTQQPGRENTNSLFVFKLFPEHLSFEAIKSDIVTLPDISFMFVKRRIIDSYISQQKAAAIGRWNDVDTTNNSIEIDVLDLLEYVDFNLEWYAGFRDLLHKHRLPYVEFLYEEHLDRDVHSVARDFAEIVQEGLCVPVAMTTEGERDTIHGRLAKQDLSTSYEAKVSNWAEVMAAMNRFPEIDIMGYF